MRGLKIAFVGKGGVGKTTLAAVSARYLSSIGFKVLAIDADPSLNLGIALGASREEVSKIKPISEMKELIRSRVESQFSSIISFTPKVDDLIDKFGLICPDGVKLLIMGTVRSGGSGCLCPENAFLKALMSHLILGRGEVIVLDMVAGLEHLGRGTAKGVDLMLCVVEPSVKSIETTRRIRELASQIGVKDFRAIGNKVSSELERKFIDEWMGKLGVRIMGYVPLDKSIMEAEMLGVSPIDYKPDSNAIMAIKSMMNKLLREFS